MGDRGGTALEICAEDKGAFPLRRAYSGAQDGWHSELSPCPQPPKVLGFQLEATIPWFKKTF